MNRRYSRQREMILQEVKSTASHPTAEAVYAKLKPQNPNLSLGTVYRNLNLLAEEGQIVRMQARHPSGCYDANCSTHAHMICTRCGKICDLDLDVAAVLDGIIHQPHPYQLLEGMLTFRGICTECLHQKA